MSSSRILIIDDDRLVQRSLGRLLSASGFDAVLAESAEDALTRVSAGGCDAVLSDIHMPGLDGVALLQRIRRLDADLPVLLMTGEPSLETAISAVEHGAGLYLLKPVTPDVLVPALRRMVGLGSLARLRRQAWEVLRAATNPPDLPRQRRHVEEALGRVHMAFQPIVAAADREVIAYEALLRCDHPVLGSPGSLLAAAERAGRLHELGREVRRQVAAAADGLPPGPLLFVNLHPADLEDHALYDPEAPLSRHAARTTLEITERASLKGDAAERIARLRALGYRIAVDDLGAGYAGLNSVLLLGPDVVKLDMALIRGIDVHAAQRSVVRSLVGLCRELGMDVVAEGVETREECDTLTHIGCGWLQGYWFARPGPPWPSVQAHP